MFVSVNGLPQNPMPQKISKQVLNNGIQNDRSHDGELVLDFHIRLLRHSQVIVLVPVIELK